MSAIDPAPLGRIARLVGLDDPGPAIRVVLAAETSGWARDVSPWTAGMAFGASGVVVLFPARAPVYPADTLEDVLRHEVAHVLIARASRGHPVPSWFHEGLSVAVERAWRFEDGARLVYELAVRPRVSLVDLNRAFEDRRGDRGARIRAYALAGAFVRDLLARHGSTAPGAILARVARGLPFETAFAEATGVTLAEAEHAFWRRQRLWTTWLPFVTSSGSLWLLVTLLALYAMHKRRQKRAAQREKWEREDDDRIW